MHTISFSLVLQKWMKNTHLQFVFGQTFRDILKNCSWKHLIWEICVSASLPFHIHTNEKEFKEHPPQIFIFINIQPNIRISLFVSCFRIFTWQRQFKLELLCYILTRPCLVFSCRKWIETRKICSNRRGKAIKWGFK